MGSGKEQFSQGYGGEGAGSGGVREREVGRGGSGGLAVCATGSRCSPAVTTICRESAAQPPDKWRGTRRGRGKRAPASAEPGNGPVRQSVVAGSSGEFSFFFTMAHILRGSIAHSLRGCRYPG